MRRVFPFLVGLTSTACVTASHHRGLGTDVVPMPTGGVEGGMSTSHVGIPSARSVPQPDGSDTWVDTWTWDGDLAGTVRFGLHPAHSLQIRTGLGLDGSADSLRWRTSTTVVSSFFPHRDLSAPHGALLWGVGATSWFVTRTCDPDTGPCAGVALGGHLGVSGSFPIAAGGLVRWQLGLLYNLDADALPDGGFYPEGTLTTGPSFWMPAGPQGRHLVVVVEAAMAWRTSEPTGGAQLTVLSRPPPTGAGKAHGRPPTSRPPAR